MIVCDDESYRLDLLCYIYLNPLRAAIVADFEELARYHLCGHQQLIGGTQYQLLATAELLPLFAKRKKAAVECYLGFQADSLKSDKAINLAHGFGGQKSCSLRRS